MIASRAFLVILCVLGVSSQASGLKASRRNLAFAGSKFGVPPGTDARKLAPETAHALLVKGGQEEEGGISISKADVLKLHGALSVAAAAQFLLTSFGVKIPVLDKVGLEAVFPGFDMGIGGQKLFTRYCAVIFFALGWIEYELADSPVVQDISKKFHIPLALVVLYTTLELGLKGFGYYPAVLIGLFALALFTAK